MNTRKCGMTERALVTPTNMPYAENTSTLVCSFCEREFQTRNVRMRRILCGDCRSYETKLPPHLGQLTIEEKQRIYKKLRYGA